MADVGFFEISVDGWPPAKNEAKSMLAVGHPYAERVVHLLTAVREVLGAHPLPFPDQSLVLELVVRSPTRPPSDATNYLGGVADVLEEKARRGDLSYLSDLARIALYRNDNQLHEVHFRWDKGDRVMYTVRIWER